MLITADTIATGTELKRPGWFEVVDDRIRSMGAGKPPAPADPALAR